MILFAVFFIYNSCSFRDISAVKDSRDNLANLVNTRMGTKTYLEFSNGGHLPIVSYPLGMARWTAQTESNGSKQIYSYDSDQINGFRCTHQSSLELGDYGAFAIFPSTDDLILEEKRRGSTFLHTEEFCTPYSYSVLLKDSDIRVEMVPTKRGGAFKLVYPDNENSMLLIDGLDGGATLRIQPDKKRVTGKVLNSSGGTPKNFACYFVIEFSKPFYSFFTWTTDSLKAQKRDVTGERAGAVIKFSTYRNETIYLKIATSFISLEQAEINFNRELENFNFDQLKLKANQEWNSKLGKVKIESKRQNEVNIFYTSLYRVLTAPLAMHEYDLTGKTIHYSPFDGRVHPGFMYANLSTWHTYKTTAPLLNLLYPESASEIYQGMLNSYREGGWLPTIPAPGYRKNGFNSHAGIIFADAIAKEITGFDYNLAYQASKKDAIVLPPKYAPGRKNLQAYNDLGFIPYTEDNSVSNTLEYAYNDFCIMLMGNALGKFDETSLYLQKSRNYKYLYDTNAHTFRPKSRDRLWQKPYDPLVWGNGYFRANGWLYRWYLPHEPQFLFQSGTKEYSISESLDSLFTIPPEFKVGSYHKVIHEMTELVLNGMGQYAHQHSASHHIPYLYIFDGKPWMTHQRVAEIRNKLYKNTSDGYCGQDISGQLSAWYIFSSLGIYPFTPGTDRYVIGTPAFEKTTMELENGKTITIKPTGVNAESFYVHKAEWNSSRLLTPTITHSDLMKGGVLDLEMESKPNRKWGNEEKISSFYENFASSEQ